MRREHPARDHAAQSANDSKTGPDDDVVRVNTELVQTDVMVFDKRGSFVDGLKRDQFELKIDGRPIKSHFLNAWWRQPQRRGSIGRRQRKPTCCRRRRDRRSAAGSRPDRAVLSRRSSPFRLKHILRRQMLTRFIDHEMGQNDQAVICSTSGQIGFSAATDGRQTRAARCRRATHNALHLSSGW